MVKINKIYTRQGDDGTTGLVGGARVTKDSMRVESYGEVDELNSVLGWARTLSERDKAQTLVEQLTSIQNDLFDIGSELATAPGSEWPGMITIGDRHTAQLEKWIDSLMEGIPELRSFVLPGGTELNAALHVCRTVCRRAERCVLRLSRTEQVSPHVIIYLNRLSDLLFAMARYESHRTGKPEYLWVPGKS
ncbi:MAG: cob(I)yrinic acid a,c-diamide adenosyltransferase [Deltaproteobacteria bacterium]|nr:cob(I)yrinic acid a,c-diamide adenosyltransferase [Deltaproteobacteria bacterium]